MRKKVISAVLASAMVLSMAACGNEPTDANSPSNTEKPAVGGATTAPDAVPTAAPTAVPDNRTEGEKLADQYNGFVETPMNLNGRTIRIACNVGSRYNYVQTDGKDDVAATTTATIEVINILKEIEKDYNCKFEITPNKKAKGIVQDLIDGKAEGSPMYDIIDEGVSSTYWDQIYAQGMVMDLNDPLIKDIIKMDTNPWKPQSDFGIYNGTQYALTFVTKNSTEDLRNALLFNKDLAKQFGLGDIYSMVKDGTWTWNKFEEMCESIAKQSNGDVVPAGYGKENLLFPMTVFSNGGYIAKRVDGKLTYVANTDEKTLAAGNWIYQLREKGYMAPNWNVKDADGKSVLVEGGVDFNGFKDGKCVFYFDFYGDLQKLTNNSAGSDGVAAVTSYHFGLLPHPLGPGSDGKYHGVTYSVDLKAICAGIEKPEEVAAVLVAIANRTAKTPENIYEEEAKQTLDAAEDLDMLKIMYNDMRSDYSRTVTGHAIGSACTHILQMDKSVEQAFESIAEETQSIYDGTLKKNWVGN